MKFPSFLRRKKKNSDVDSTSEAAPVKPKSSPGKNATGGGVKLWLFLNVEKIIILGIFGLLIYLVSDAVGKLRPERSQTPDDLKQQVELINNRIENSTFPSQRFPVPDYAEQADRGQQKVREAHFEFPSPAGDALFHLAGRADPKIYPPISLQARGGNGVFFVAKRAAQPGAGVAGQAPGVGAGQEKPLPAELRKQAAEGRQNAQTEGRRWVVVNALLSYSRQLKEYERSFKFAEGFEPKRDVPQFFIATISRLEIAPGETGTEAEWEDAKKWTLQDWLSQSQAEWKSWAGQDKELVDPQFIAQKSFRKMIFSSAMPLGPLAEQSWQLWATHGGIGLRATTEPKPDTAKAAPQQPKPKPPKEPKNDDAFGDLFGNDEAEKAVKPADQVAPEKVAKPAAVKPSQPKRPKVPKYKLVRIFDYSVEPGKRYRYKVKLSYFNPNRKGIGIAARHLENPSSLDQRFVESDWSRPSQIVTVPEDTQVYASQVQWPNQENPYSEPQASVIAEQLNVVNGRRTSAGLQLNRGGIVRGKHDILRVEPRRQTVVRQHDVALKTDITLLDMNGGGGNGFMNRPTELLFMGQGGSLFLRRSIDDTDAVNHFNTLNSIFGNDNVKEAAVGAPDTPRRQERDRRKNPLLRE